MVLEYGGCRLEEAAGLAVEDVIRDPMPHLHIRPNEFRRIKNAPSDRLVPIHPELIRLGFLEYVARIAALGYRCVFPDLYSPNSQAPIGGRLYDEFRRILKWACEELGLSTDHDLHSIRHGLDTRLKDAEVPEEFRQDLMGHEGAPKPAPDTRRRFRCRALCRPGRCRSMNSTRNDLVAAYAVKQWVAISPESGRGELLDLR